MDSQNAKLRLPRGEHASRNGACGGAARGYHAGVGMDQPRQGADLVAIQSHVALGGVLLAFRIDHLLAADSAAVHLLPILNTINVMIPRDVSLRISNIGIVCASLVVVDHVYLILGNGQFYGDAFIGNRFVKIAVPSFFTVAGYLLSQHMIHSVNWWGKEIGKRFKTLLIPYILWNLMFFVFVRSINVISNLSATRTWNYGLDFSLECMFQSLFIDPILYPSWFIRMLFVLVVLSPILLRMANMVGIGCVLLLYWGIGVLSAQLGLPWLRIFQFGFSIEGVFYFILGIYLNRRIGLKILNFSVACESLVIGLGLMMLDVVLCGWNIVCFGKIFVLIGVWGMMAGVAFPSWLVKEAFPIYLLHPFVLSAMKVVLKNTNSLQVALESVFGVVLCVGFCLLCSFLISKGIRFFLPCAAKILYGAR